MASAKALAGLSPTLRDRNAGLLPPIADARRVSLLVGEAVGSRRSQRGLLKSLMRGPLRLRFAPTCGKPVYVPYKRQNPIHRSGQHAR